VTINFSKSEIESITNRIDPKKLSKVSKLVLFVGHAHSGHSIIGATLDAHPEIAIANEVNIVKLIRDHRCTKQQIESILYSESLKNAKQGSWHNSEYQYNISESDQGKTQFPAVIGDKKAGGTTRILLNDYWVLEYLQTIYKQNFKIIFVRRNPIDIVAAYAYYMKQAPSQFHVDRYNENLAVVERIKRSMDKSSFIEVRQENFIKEPNLISQNLFNFLDLSTSKELLELWTRNVRSDLKGKSHQIDIPDSLVRQLPR
jgi:hypothetical protein